jgi:hypothetical protein
MKLFFHIRSGPALIEDPDGGEFATLSEALHEARCAARDLLAERLRAGQGDSAELEVWSHDGRHVLSVGFAAAEMFPAQSGTVH